MTILGVYKPARNGPGDPRRPWQVMAVWAPRDLWIGAYYSPIKHQLRVMLLPTLGLCIEWAERVMCHAPECTAVAEFKCIHMATGKDNYVLGTGYARDPLCSRHGAIGQCPTDTEAVHVPIPPGQKWRTVWS